MSKMRRKILRGAKAFFNACIRLIGRLFLEKLSGLSRRRQPEEKKTLLVGRTADLDNILRAAGPVIAMPPAPPATKAEKKSPKYRNFPNMPKYQPCPKCGGWRKREEKVASTHMVGAWYYCSRDNLRYFENL